MKSHLWLTIVFIAIPGVLAAAPAVDDRYGPPPAQDDSSHVRRAPQRLLSWANKPPIDQTDSAPAPVAQAAPPPALPAPPPPAPAPVVAQAAPAVGAHFYSLHRAYGDQPDSIPIPVDRPPVLIGPGDPMPAGLAEGDQGQKSDRDSSDPAS